MSNVIRRPQPDGSARDTRKRLWIGHGCCNRSFSRGPDVVPADARCSPDDRRPNGSCCSTDGSKALAVASPFPCVAAGLSLLSRCPALNTVPGMSGVRSPIHCPLHLAVFHNRDGEAGLFSLAAQLLCPRYCRYSSKALSTSMAGVAMVLSNPCRKIVFTSTYGTTGTGTSRLK